MNATAEAAAAKKAQAALAKAIRQRNNANSAKFLAAGTVSMMVLFIIFHWTRYIFKRYESRTTGSNTLVTVPVLITRKARNLLLRKVPGFTSLGHALVFIGYFTTCIAIAFTNLDWTTLNYWAKRLGWVAVSNIALITFLALKNTPLAFLSAYSYERLNILHQIAGYGTVFWTMMHAVVYITAWSKSDSLPELEETPNVMGIVAGFAMLIILSTSLLFRKLRYEFWYITHIIMFMLILIAVGMHRPLISNRVVVIVIFTACIWVSDRALRFSKISFYSFGNAATVTPLPHGGTRIVLRKSSSRAKPGKHCFLWIPKVRATETHPFTIISSDQGSLSFIVAAYDGFTRDLHNYAVQNPGASLKASIDGPYGTVPNFTAFTKLVLIAGGSGGSFTFGVAIDTIRKLGSSTATTIEFIWVVREQESITWYSSELQELIASHLVNLHIHSTRSTSTTNPYTLTHTPKSSAPSLEDDEKVYLSGTDTSTVTPAPVAVDIDVEKHQDTTMSSQPRSLTVHAGRPDISGIIKDIIGRSDRHDRVAVAACGPDGLMAVTRETTAKCIRSDGPSIELHCEQFGW